MVRPEIATLQSLGPLPDEAWVINNSSLELLKRYEELIGSIHAPMSDEEACSLTSLFPNDDSSTFGLAWSVLHLIEAAPGWPVPGSLENVQNYWIKFLRDRARRAGYVYVNAPATSPTDLPTS
jgi:hypothetical protein